MRYAVDGGPWFGNGTFTHIRVVGQFERLLLADR